MYKVLRKILFLFDAEQIHEFSTISIKILNKIPYLKNILSKFYRVENKILERKILGLKFKNPIGLAAGFDKNAELYNDFSIFGFGFIEIGTVTPLPQPGNPKKRIFRLVEDKSLINRLGFNNKGLDVVSKNLKNKGNLIVGANIGKNFFTENSEGIDDYLKCLSVLHNYVDYFAINISSPNTKNLRDFHNQELLKPLLEKLINYNQKQKKYKPLLLKISPDIDEDQLNQIINITTELGLDGIIATNTTISRISLKSNNKNEKGGLSGEPLKERSNEVIRLLRKKLGPNFPIIGVGGVMTPEDAIEKIKSGADLIQLYTGFVYEGPNIVKRINKALISQNN